jgi:hypothetical protein
MLKRIAPAVALGLIAIIPLSVCETCIGKGRSLRAQMACCASESHHSSADQARLCCEMTQPLQDRLILTASLLPVTPPVPVAMPVAALAAIPTASQFSAVAYGEPLVRLQSPPAYILTGSLLI